MLVVAGESLIDLVAQSRPGGGPLEFGAHPGGSPYNCAIALARLGNDTGFLCPISRDGFGDLLLGPLTEAGAVPLIGQRSDRNSTLAIVTRNEMGLPRYAFYREGTAERDISPAKLQAALPETIDLFQMGGFLPIDTREAGIWLDLAGAVAARGAVLSIDPNVRPSLVDDFQGYKKRLSAFLDLTHIVKMSNEDLATLDAGKSLEAHVQALLARPNMALVVVTEGENGARAFTRNAQAKTPIFSPAQSGDTVGAGDAMMAGILTAIADRSALEVKRIGELDGTTLAEILRFGAVTAGLNCGHIGCKPPRRSEVEAVLAEIATRRPVA